MKKNLGLVVGIAIAIILGLLLTAHELFWRFDPQLDMLRTAEIMAADGSRHTLSIRQTSSSAVDTVRRDFKDVRHGKTSVALWLDGATDTLRTTIDGRYYSEFRGFRISTDRSTQVFLVPNTEHALPAGWGELVYIKPDGKLSHTSLYAMNIGDVDKDTVLEVFDPKRDVFTRLDPATGSWVPIAISPKPDK